MVRQMASSTCTATSCWRARWGRPGPAVPEIGHHPDGSPWFRVGNYQLDGVAYRGSLFIEVDMRLAAMDAAGISVQALSPNPLTYLHFIDAPAAVEFCRAHNDSLAEVVADHPDRFVGLGALPMQDIEAACVELQRIVADLGLLGAYIGTDFGHAAGCARNGRALRVLYRVGRAAVHAPHPIGDRRSAAGRAPAPLGSGPGAGVLPRGGPRRGHADLRRGAAPPSGFGHLSSVTEADRSPWCSRSCASWPSVVPPRPSG